MGLDACFMPTRLRDWREAIILRHLQAIREAGSETEGEVI